MLQPINTSSKSISLKWFALLGVLGCLNPNTVAGGEIPLKNGQKLAFMGDSITQFGWKSADGYVRLVVAGLKANGLTVTPIPAGVGGDTSKKELARLDSAVLNHKPDWMTLSCGVNDVSLRPEKHISLDQFKLNITEMVDKAHKAGVKIMILTPTGNGADLESVPNKELVSYCEFLRALAKERGFLCADLNSDFRAAMAAHPENKKLLTVDGTHMNREGNQLMALGVLKAFGLSEAQLATAQSAWTAIPAK